MVGIYKITNLINGKSYIGQSVHIELRIRRHKEVAFRESSQAYNYPLYRAMRKYGLDNFSFEILEECKMSELDDKERQYIKQYNTYGENGYNQNTGGYNAEHSRLLDDEALYEIIKKLKTTTESSEDIGREFGISGRAIRSINAGEYYHQEDECYPIRPPLWEIETLDDGSNYQIKQKNYYCELCGVPIGKYSRYCVKCGHEIQRKVEERPAPMVLAELIKEKGFVKTGEMFGVSDNAIKKWCEMYGMPRLKKEVIAWYDKQVTKQ